MTLHCQDFLTTRGYFLYMSSVGMMNITLAILVVFESRGLRKSYIHFSNNTISVSTVIISLGNYIWGI